MQLELKTQNQLKTLFYYFIIGGSNITRLLVCENADDNTVRLSCSDNKVLHILTAMYGRKEKNTCNSCTWINIFCDTNCEKPDSLNRVKNRCEGSSSCHFKADNDFFVDPCYGTVKYLQLAYQCVFKLGMYVCMYVCMYVSNDIIYFLYFYIITENSLHLKLKFSFSIIVYSEWKSRHC